MSMVDDFKNVFDPQGKNDFTNFSACIFRLIPKADPININRLRHGWPRHVELWEAWQLDRDPEHFDFTPWENIKE